MDKTLRELLDANDIGPGNNDGFIIQTSLFSNTEMNVSRRYLEGPVFRYLLDKKVLSVVPYTSVFGETVKIILED